MPEYGMEIDLSPLVRELGVSFIPNMNTISEGVRAATQYVRDTWSQAVQGKMLPGMSRPINNDDYMESLHTSQALQMFDATHGAVICTYPHIERIEQGYASYDMKPALLGGPSVRRSKDGHRYNVIPFRHMTPQKGMPDGAARAHGQTMPLDVYKIVKRDGSFHDPANAALGQQLGQRTKIAGMVNIEALVRGEVEGKPNLPMQGNYTWRYGLYHGMRRVMKQYGKVDQSTYITWRAVSDKSDPSSWIHPGQGPNGVIEAVIAATSQGVEEIIMDAARSAFGV